KDAEVRRFFYASSACGYAADKQTDTNVTALKEEDAYPAMPEDGYGWEKLFSERMCRHFMEDFGLTTRVARFHNVYGPQGTWEGGREKAPAAICRKVISAKLAGKHEIEIWGDAHQKIVGLGAGHDVAQRHGKDLRMDLRRNDEEKIAFFIFREISDNCAKYKLDFVSPFPPAAPLHCNYDYNCNDRRQ